MRATYQFVVRGRGARPGKVHAGDTAALRSLNFSHVLHGVYRIPPLVSPYSHSYLLAKLLLLGWPPSCTCVRMFPTAATRQFIDQGESARCANLVTG